MRENKMYSKLQYKCGICDTVYNSIEERVKCETACLKKKKEEERKAAEMKKQQEQKARKKEVDEAVKKAKELKDKYVEDYGCYVNCCTMSYDDLPFTDLIRMLS